MASAQEDFIFNDDRAHRWVRAGGAQRLSGQVYRVLHWGRMARDHVSPAILSGYSIMLGELYQYGPCTARLIDFQGLPRIRKVGRQWVSGIYWSLNR